MQTLYEIIYFIFPLLFAGIIHHLIIIKYNLFSTLAKPIDNNFYFKGNPLFGKAKTWRGLIIVPLASGVGSFFLSQVISIPIAHNPALVGFLLGFGYAIAELPNSFIKRRLTIPASKKSKAGYAFIFLILDQIDSVLGSTLVMIILYPSTIVLIVSVILIGGFLHFSIDTFLYKHGYKKMLHN